MFPQHYPRRHFGNPEPDLGAFRPPSSNRAVQHLAVRVCGAPQGRKHYPDEGHLCAGVAGRVNRACRDFTRCGLMISET
ncbi:hypothetical protein AGIG_G3994 [Arapaima gigas]